MASDNTIDDAVVRISPDLSKFRKELQAKLKEATAGVDAKVKLVADATGWGKSVRAALAGKNTPTAKVRLAADATGWTESVRLALAKKNMPTGKVQLAPDMKSLDRNLRAALKDYTVHVKVQVEATRAVLDQARIQAELERLAKRSEDRQTRDTQRGANERTRIREREAGQSALLKASETQIFESGGRGVRPINALIAAAVALSPALIAVSSSAVLASTSVAALGAAGIGAAAGLGAVVLGFTGIAEALKLRVQVRKEEQRTQTAAKKSATQDSAAEAQAQALAAARRSLRDATRGVGAAERDVADADKKAAAARVAVTAAYKDAAQKVKDLREQIADLRLEEQQGALDVASAREKQLAVNRNFWATDIEKRQAALDVQKALDRQSDAHRERLQKTAELNKRVTLGPNKSPEVVAARADAARAARDAADARRAVTDARERVADARKAVTDAQRKQADSSTAATNAASTAAQDLQDRINRLSPAARAMYYWFKANEGELDKLRRKMEQAILPGFLTFLKEITKRPRGGKSAFDLMADNAARLGRIIGNTVGKIGKLTRTKWFRRDLVKINGENEKSFTLLGKAAVTLIKPFVRITAAASPLFTKLSAWILKVSTQFSDFIDKHVKDGSLVRWFTDAGAELGKWAGIAKNLLTFLKNVFLTSLPTGKDLVSRFGKLTETLAKWSSSPEGRKQLSDFFDRFKKIDYKDLVNLVGQLGLLYGGLRVFTFGRKHPFFLLLGMLATSYPDATRKVIEATSAAIVTMLNFAAKHPKEATAILGILTALRYARSITIGLEVLGLSGLAGAVTTAAAAAPIVAAVVAALAALGYLAYKTNPKQFQSREQRARDDAKRTGQPFVKPPPVNWKNKTVGDENEFWRHWYAITLPNALNAGVGQGGWAGLAKNTQRWLMHTLPDSLNLGKGTGWGAFVDDYKHWWGHTLPDSLNLGKGTGWSALGANLGTWFSTSMPNFMSGTTGGWAGLGRVTLDKFLNFLGWPAIRGIWQGISDGSAWLWEKVSGWKDRFVDWFKKLFGIKSPSTVFADLGTSMIEGLWDGFTTKWNDLLKTVKTFISDSIGGPLAKGFADVGRAARAAFVTPFDTLTAALTKPVKAAMDWLDTNLIDNLNKLLTAVGVTGIPNINFGAGKPGARTGLGSKPAPLDTNAVRQGNGNIGRPIVRADGGPVPGHSPHPRADNIPAMLTANEYVHPVDTVKHYGVGFMDAIRRKEIPKYAGGGLVAGMTSALGGPNLVTDVVGGAISKIGSSVKDIAKGIINRFTSIFAGGGTPVGDLDVARTAEATARAMSATDKQLVALMEAGIVESGMRNLNYGDRDSLGFLQQRPSQGWGSPAQVMDVAYATRSFIRAAKAKDNDRYSAGQLAQAVQVSAFPDRYATQEASAVAILNREAPFLSGGGGGPFGPWPPSAASVHGHDSGVWRRIIAMVDAAQIPHGQTAGYDDRRTDNGTWSWHASGHAVDFMGFDQDRLAQFFEARKPSVLELIHRSKQADYGIQRGHDHDMGHEFGLHRNHLHVAMADGGLVPMRKYDSGGDLPPGVTLAVNGTGRTETVRTAAQEKQLQAGGNMRLDRRDIVLLAQYIASAQQPEVHMDGRKVAEVTNSYAYLPAGV